MTIAIDTDRMYIQLVKRIKNLELKPNKSTFVFKYT